MHGPTPSNRPTFPSDFLDHCRSVVRRRTAPHGQHQRARLVLCKRPRFPGVCPTAERRAATPSLTERQAVALLEVIPTYTG
jgi:hypothetical protein